MSKTPFDAERGKSILKFDPEDLAIELDPTKPLYQRRGTEPAIDEMVASIKARGVIVPIIIVRGEKDRPYVAAGARRTIAARAANKELKAEGLPPKLIPAVFRDEKGAEGISLKIIENAMRRDLPLTAKAEEARLAITAGYSEAQVAEWFGVSASTIKNWAEVPHLHASVQKALDAGTVRLVEAIREVGKLPKGEQPAALSKLEAERPTRAAKKAAGTKTKRQVTPVARLRRLEGFLDEHPGSLPDDAAVMLTWLRGDLTDRNLAAQFGGLAPMFEKAAKRKGVR
jgi:ParB family transcriptional regulator, chromosome partitioning protein